MLVDDTDSAPDIRLELCSGRVDRISEVYLVGEFGEGGQERFNRGVGTGRREVLNVTINYYFQISGKTTAYRNNERDDAREDVRTDTSSLPADRATPIMSRMT